MPARRALPANSCKNVSDAHAASDRSRDRATSGDEATSFGALTGTGVIGEKQAPRTPRTARSISGSPGSSRTKLLSKRSEGNAPSGSSRMGAGRAVAGSGRLTGVVYAWSDSSRSSAASASMSARSAVTLDAPSGVPSTVATTNPSSHFWQRLRQSFTTGVCSRSLSSDSKGASGAPSRSTDFRHSSTCTMVATLPASLDVLHEGVGISELEARGFLETRHLLGAERQVSGLHVLVQLRQRARAEDAGGDLRLGQQPGQRHGDRGGAGLGGDGADSGQNLQVAVAVDPRHAILPLFEGSPGRRRLVLVVFSGQEAGRQRR